MTAPFGIEIAQPLSDAVKQVDLGNGKWAVLPPRRPPNFSEFYAEEQQGFGVFWLKAVTATFSSDAYGHAARAEFQKIAGQLTKLYGRCKTADILHHGSIWDEPRNWVASLYENERSFFMMWERANGSTLPDDLSSVFLCIVTQSHSDCSVGLEYASTDFDAAERDKDSDLASYL